MGLIPSAQERALQLARNGQVRDMARLRETLQREGYNPDRIPLTVVPAIEAALSKSRH